MTFSSEHFSEIGPYKFYQESSRHRSKSAIHPLRFRSGVRTRSPRRRRRAAALAGSPSAARASSSPRCGFPPLVCFTYQGLSLVEAGNFNDDAAKNPEERREPEGIDVYMDEHNTISACGLAKGYMDMLAVIKEETNIEDLVKHEKGEDVKPDKNHKITEAFVAK
uniref:Uncharacterized protein n=1 Tax=Leersia perrieri TaxID=77586 RepID=A0A0D9W9K3_9ORYZ